MEMTGESLGGGAGKGNLKGPTNGVPFVHTGWRVPQNPGNTQSIHHLSRHFLGTYRCWGRVTSKNSPALKGLTVDRQAHLLREAPICSYRV